MESTHNPVAGSERRPLPGAIAKGPASANAVIEVSVKLKRKTPLPPLTGRPQEAISREQLAKEFGADPADIDKVVKAFSPFGLKPVGTSLASRTVRFQGTNAAIEKAFNVKLLNYSHVDDNYRGRVGPVSVPNDVKDMVVGVFGLDNRRVARRRRQPLSGASHSQMASVPSAWYIPSELADHYNFPASDGSGQTVGLLEFGGGYFSSDLEAFCELVKITAPPKVVTISTDGTATDSRDGAEGEVMLDIEVVAGICPKANIVVYFAQWTEQGWITAIDAAVHDQTNDPGVVSASWGNAEDTDIWTQQAMTQ